MATYKPSRKGMGEIMRSPRVRGLMELKAREAAGIAQNLAPDAPPLTEGYVDNFEVHAGTRKIAGTRRAVADLVNTSAYAAAVEWGWFAKEGVGHAGYHVLGQTADVIGDE